MKKGRRRYDHQTLYDERQYGLYWYDWLWKLLRPLMVGVASLLLTAGILLTGWNWLGERLWFPADANDHAPVSFTVESGSSLSSVANQLEQQGLIRNHAVLKYLMDFQGLSQKVQAGTYTLTKSMTLSEMIDQLTQGDGKALTANITIIPGWNIEKIAEYLVEEGVAQNVQEVYDACNDRETYSAYYYIAEILNEADAQQRIYLLEGYLAPDTYEIYTSASLESVMKKLLAQTEVVFSSAYHDRAAELGMTMDEVITLASMIELEAKSEDFARVSAIFHNRLKQNMTLGSDVTVQYFTRSDKMALGSEEINQNSPYNTYINKGLPTGPVCNPSKAAIQAALYPDETFIAEQYLYFCSTSPEEGTLYFSKTLQEHEAAVAIYRPLWEQYDQQRGAQ